MSSDLYSKKWQKFQKQKGLFRYIPFVDFVCAAGSLATGNVHEDSDFDVIIGVRQGRIFTTRMFCFFVFKPLGLWARHDKKDNPKSYRNKLCFNHFVTPNAYRLSPPYNEYWKTLYRSLIPVYGDPEAIQKFFEANEDWANTRTSEVFGRRKSNFLTRFTEWFLSGKFGDVVEKLFKKIQLGKIKFAASRVTTHKPRIIISDDELEFHPDTRRIENFSDMN